MMDTAPTTPDGVVDASDILDMAYAMYREARRSEVDYGPRTHAGIAARTAAASAAKMIHHITGADYMTWSADPRADHTARSTMPEVYDLDRKVGRARYHRKETS